MSLVRNLKFSISFGKTTHNQMVVGLASIFCVKLPISTIFISPETRLSVSMHYKGFEQISGLTLAMKTSALFRLIILDNTNYLNTTRWLAHFYQLVCAQMDGDSIYSYYTN